MELHTFVLNLDEKDLSHVLLSNFAGSSVVEPAREGCFPEFSTDFVTYLQKIKPHLPNTAYGMENVLILNENLIVDLKK